MWKTSISDNKDYPSFCESASKDDLLFSSFKTNPIYNRILEHTHPQYGLIYAQHLYQKVGSIEEFKRIVKLASVNDVHGGSVLVSFDLAGEILNVSPSTLRYIKVAFDLVELTGQDTKTKTICEIGGGYGGQCVVFDSIFGFKRWDILDLKEVNMLQAKYLSKNGVNNVSANCLETEMNILDSYDLVVSNYAFSECKREIQDEYMDRVLKHAAHGYMTMNFCWNNQEQGESWCETNGFCNMYTVEELIDNIPTIQVYKEDPQTHPKNILLKW